MSNYNPNLVLNVIVARSKNNIIGDPQGNIPWHLPNDFKWFKDKTMGGAVMMGRKTWQSIGRLLPGRTNIIVTRDVQKLLDSEEFKTQFDNMSDGTRVLVTDSPFDCIAEHQKEFDTLWIIGGGELYRLALKTMRIKNIYVTEVDTIVPIDGNKNDYAQFYYNKKHWVEEWSSRYNKPDARHNFGYTFRILKNKV